ncbi:uncharacterized protein [Spinacia oleracea]|uniref:Reverse transcriptase domain-containing protein n=1 Tax=Spinacia oleracea TaxID=3562 RepID=A0ABM3QQB2_SPIOL|nr:uncharacterized protein LOC130461466 [Spinacia oleracea]
MSFSTDDCRGITYDHEDPLVVSVDIANHTVHRVLVDGGSSASILFRCAFDKLKIDPRQLAKVNFLAINFNGSSVVPDGKITLPATIGRRQTARNNLTEFLVVDMPTVYYVIMERPLIHKVKGVASTYHQMMLYVSDAGTPEKLRGNQESARQCDYNAVKTRNRRDFDTEEDSPEEESDLQEAYGGTKRKSADVESNRSTLMTDIEGRPDNGETQTNTEMEDISLEEGGDPPGIRIGTDLGSDLKIMIVNLLRDYKDIFAFSAEDMPGIDPKTVTHKLNVLKGSKPIKQRLRNYSAEKSNAVAEEVKKLKDAGFIEPCKYPEWLANIVMEKNPNGSWRMCVDFTNINQACPKDCYPLPRIDQLVDSTSGHALLSFMDAFSGYHQIFMDSNDRAKTTFITSGGVYNYIMMPLGLKNAGATYQRLVDHVFADQKGRNVEVYVDDSIVKSKKR